jgi:Holliday junction resolvase
VNSNYRKGREREYRTKHLLEAAGYTVARSASSKGKIDIWAVDGIGFRLIQVKDSNANVTPHEREALQMLPHPPNCTVEVWRWPDRVREPLIERIG